MWFTILQIIQLILTLILESENRFPTGTGSEKRSDVMKGVGRELRTKGMLETMTEEAGSRLEEAFGGVVDGLVSVLNLTGAFSHRPKAESEPDGAAGRELPPNE